MADTDSTFEIQQDDLERTMSPENKPGPKEFDEPHRWEVEPHPWDSDFDMFVTDDDYAARDAILHAAEMHLWDGNDGEERTLRVTMNKDIPAVNASRAPVVAPQADAATKAKNRDKAQRIVLSTEAVLGERLNIVARHELTDRIAAALDAAPSPSSPVPAEQKHHKHCSSWTVNTSGERQPCDCVCECRHTMFEHIRPGEHYWYEDCAVEACPCMKFATIAN